MITFLNVIDTGGPGGAETVFLNLATGLDPTQFRAVNVVSREGWLADQIRARGAHAPCFVPASGSVNFAYLSRLVALAREHRVDAIVAHLYGAAVYCSLAGLRLGIPVISVLHGQSDLARGGRFAFLKRAALRLGTRRMVFVSRRLADELSRPLKIPRERTEVIANGIDLRRFDGTSTRPLRAELPLRDDQILVAAVGNIRGPKSYATLLQAAARLCEHSQRYHVAIAGEGSGELYEQLLELRRTLQLETRVTFLGLRADVPEILRSCDVYVLSSTTEGFSIACIEAMAAGVPVVSTRSGGPQEILEHERTGLLVPVSDAEALAGAIERVTADPALRAGLTRAARARVAECYTLDAMLSGYARLLREVTGLP